MRRRAKSFHLASLFLPPSVRGDVQTLYRYFRWIDDLVDEPAPQDVADLLTRIEFEVAAGKTRDPIVHPTLAVASRYAIPTAVLLEIIRGARLDLEYAHFSDAAEMYRYADLVAGSVGACLCYLLGDPIPEALTAARWLGIAMQLTNILRDVGEDLANGRVYLPLEDLERFGLSVEDLRTPAISRAFGDLMAFEIERARACYDLGLVGLQFLRPSCRPSIAVAATLYAGILTKIESISYQVLDHRAHLTLTERVLTLPRVFSAVRLNQGPLPDADTSVRTEGRATGAQRQDGLA